MAQGDHAWSTRSHEDKKIGGGKEQHGQDTRHKGLGKQRCTQAHTQDVPGGARQTAQGTPDGAQRRPQRLPQRPSGSKRAARPSHHRVENNTLISTEQRAGDLAANERTVNLDIRNAIFGMDEAVEWLGGQGPTTTPQRRLTVGRLPERGGSLRGPSCSFGSSGGAMCISLCIQWQTHGRPSEGNVWLPWDFTCNC